MAKGINIDGLKFFKNDFWITVGMPITYSRDSQSQNYDTYTESFALSNCSLYMDIYIIYIYRIYIYPTALVNVLVIQYLCGTLMVFYIQNHTFISLFHLITLVWISSPIFNRNSNCDLSVLFMILEEIFQLKTSK